MKHCKSILKIYYLLFLKNDIQNIQFSVTNNYKYKTSKTLSSIFILF